MMCRRPGNTGFRAGNLEDPRKLEHGRDPVECFGIG